MEKTNSLILMLLLASSTAWSRLKIIKSGSENPQSQIPNRTENRKVFLTIKQSPYRMLNIALKLPLNIFIANNDECKNNRDCMDEEFCWNGYCFTRGIFGDPCLMDDHCSEGLICSKLIESKDGLCIFNSTLVSLLTKNNTKNITSLTDKPGINSIVDDGVIKIRTSADITLETILTHKGEGDIKNEKSIEFPSNFVETTTLEKINTTDFPLSVKDIVGEITMEFPSSSTTNTDDLSRITTKVSPTTEITTLPSLVTDITSEDRLLTLPAFLVINATKDTSSTMSPLSPATEIATEDLLSSFPSTLITEIASEETSPMSVTSLRIPTFSIIENTTKDTLSTFPSFPETEIINNTISTTFLSSDMTEIITKELSTFASSELEDNNKDEITKISPTTEITTLPSLVTEITSEDRSLILPPFLTINATKDTSSTMSPISPATEVTIEDLLSSFPSTLITEIASEETSPMSVTSLRIPTFSIIENTTKDTSFPETEIINNTISTTFFSSDMTEIITKEELSTFASSELEDNNKDEITKVSPTTEITTLPSLVTEITSEDRSLILPPFLTTNATKDTSSTMSPLSPTTEVTTEDLLSSFSSTLITEIASEETSTISVKSLRIPTFSVIENTTKDTLSTIPSFPETEIINNTISTTFLSSDMTEIITKEELSTFASSELEDSNKDEITDFSSFVTENSTVNKTTNEFVFTVMAENDNISETKEEVSTISNTHELSATTDLPEKNVSEIESSSKKHFEIVGVGSSYLSALINSSTTGLQNTTTFTSYLSSQSHYWCNNGWEFFRGRCYAQIEEVNYTYYEAKKSCMDMGAVLVTVANEDTTEFLYSNFHFQYPFWIGLSNDGNGWKWPDNTKLRYQLWGKNEPNIMYSCVFAETEKNGKYWYTNDCNRTITHNDIVGYVCQQ